MKIGAHVSAAGGIDKAVDRGTAIGADLIQIFASPPQSYAPPTHTPATVRAFVEKAKQAGLGPNFIHAIYLLNLATPRKDLLDRSVGSLISTMNFAHEIGVQGVIFHTGSTLGLKFEAVRSQVTSALNKVLQNTPDQVQLIIENSAGMGGSIGSKPEEIGAMVADLKSDRVTTCLDTQHAFASGYDLRKKEGIDRLLSEWDAKIGLKRLVCLHINDSKTEFNSGRDRHENIGQGLIGKDGLTLVKSNNLLGGLPWILEVPGFAGTGPDKDNIDLVRGL